MPQPLRVLVFIDWYLPGYKAGGPIQTVAAIVRSLGREMQFSIVTSDTDFTETTPYPDVRADAWNTLADGTRVYYCSQSGMSRQKLAAIIRDEPFDVAYFNSVFSIPFFVRPLRLVRRLKPQARIVLAPRGMLGRGALAIKAWKKRPFLVFLRATGWLRGISWQASSEQEAHEIRDVFGSGALVHVAPDLSPIELKAFVPREKTSDELRLFFLSRVSPKKNLAEALRLLARVKPAFRVHYSIYGPVDDEAYWESCRSQIERLPAHVTATYHGSIDHALLHDRLKSEHALLLLTHHENFGHVVLESFAMSCPVVLSDQTPWRDLEARHLGWDLPLAASDRIVAAIETLAAMDDATYRSWSESAYQFAKTYLADSHVVEQTRRLLGG